LSAPVFFDTADDPANIITQKLQRAIILEHKKNMKAKGPTFDVLYERKAVKAQEMPTGIRRGWFGVALR